VTRKTCLNLQAKRILCREKAFSLDVGSLTCHRSAAVATSCAADMRRRAWGDAASCVVDLRRAGGARSDMARACGEMCQESTRLVGSAWQPVAMPCGHELGARGRGAMIVVASTVRGKLWCRHAAAGRECTTPALRIPQRYSLQCTQNLRSC
jgi:hypothetical protein